MVTPEGNTKKKMKKKTPFPGMAPSFSDVALLHHSDLRVEPFALP